MLSPTTSQMDRIRTNEMTMGQPAGNDARPSTITDRTDSDTRQEQTKKMPNAAPSDHKQKIKTPNLPPRSITFQRIPVEDKLEEWRIFTGIGRGEAWGRKAEWGNGFTYYSTWPERFDHVTKALVIDSPDTVSQNHILREAYNAADDEVMEALNCGIYQARAQMELEAE